VTPTTTSAPTSPQPGSIVPASRLPAPTEPTHGCARCGAPVGPGVGLCETCNPLGLRDVAASQVHGTVFVAVVVGVIVLAFLARLAVAGVGPFSARVDAVAPGSDGLAVTLTITNDGEATGQTTCRIAPIRDRSTSGGSFVLTPRLAPGETRSFTTTVAELAPGVRGAADLVVTCRTP
jgi:hypothetical protein